MINEMEQSIIDNLSQLDAGYCRLKWKISEDTGIPEDVLTVLLKRLKYAEKVRIINIFDERTGLVDGSGYQINPL